jgi:hypothetical protein
MTVGIPGAGIGGLFYLLSALAMPLRELARAAGGSPTGDTAIERRARRRLAWRQAALALGTIAALGAAGELIGLLIGPRAGQVAASGTLVGLQRILPRTTLALTFGSLALVLLAVQVARVVVGRRATSGDPRLAISSPADTALPDAA